jgi:hypothetical protein
MDVYHNILKFLASFLNLTISLVVLYCVNNHPLSHYVIVNQICIFFQDHGSIQLSYSIQGMLSDHIKI